MTNKFFGVKLILMKRLHKKIISAFLPIPLFFAITFCCCIEKDASADESLFSFSIEHHQELEKSNHSEHHHDSQGEDDCTCPKHLSFLSEQFVEIIFDSSFSQMLAKNFTADPQITNIFLLASLSKQSQGPPSQNRSYPAVPIYLKISNLRI